LFVMTTVNGWLWCSRQGHLKTLARLVDASNVRFDPNLPFQGRGQTPQSMARHQALEWAIDFCDREP
jgi:hypothetical protein